MFQHHRLANRPPGDAAGRNRATGASDVLADGEIEVMALQTRPRISRRMPELSVPGIEVDIDPAGDHPHSGMCPMTGDVHQGCRGSHEVVQFGGGEAVSGPSSQVSVARSESPNCSVTSRKYSRLADSSKVQGRPEASTQQSASDLLDERDFEAQGLEPERPAQAGPGRATVVTACWPEHR